MKIWNRWYLIFLLLLSLGGYFVSKSYAAFVSPTRVFINDGRNSSGISILNRSDETLVYTFEWERRVRSKDGKETFLLKDGETYDHYKPADPYLVFSPRRVVIEPGETQRVRIFARRPADMEPGEYRSHLKITSDSLEDPEKPNISEGFGGTLTIRPAMSIPVMLRTGKTVVDVKITGANIVREGNVDVAKIGMANSSTRSIYGWSLFKCTKPGVAEPVLAKSNGFRLYYETETLEEEFIVPKETPVSECSSLDVELYASRDLEYDHAAFATVKLK